MQALVNLKRPTLRLSPLSSSLPDDAPTTDQHLHLHGLEFTYDCDAPKCGVYVYVHLAKDHPDAPPTPANLAKLQVFEIIQDGGFGNKLTIEDGAVLELERFEYVNGVAVGVENRDRAGCEEKKMSGEESLPIGVGDGTAQLNGSNVDVTPNVAAGEINNNSGSNNHNSNYLRRFSHFHFRKLHLHRRVNGPALTVVDAERNGASRSATAPDEAKTLASSKAKDGDGVKVTIRLVALDEQGSELESPNEQLIYLHIVRESTRSDVSEEDSKTWVVKVVKREATVKLLFYFRFRFLTRYNLNRLDLTLSTCTKFMVCPHLPRDQKQPLLHIHIHPTRLYHLWPAQMMKPSNPSVCYAFRHLERWCSSHAGI